MFARFVHSETTHCDLRQRACTAQRMRASVQRVREEYHEVVGAECGLGTPRSQRVCVVLQAQRGGCAALGLAHRQPRVVRESGHH